MFLKIGILILIGVISGWTIGSGVFAFITTIGVVPRLIARTKTAKKIVLYENAIILGGTLGNICTTFSVAAPVGKVGLIVIGLFCGIFVGCLAMSIAETLNVLPIFIEKIGLEEGLAIIVLFFAIGKGMGSFYQLYFL
ncbi:stage V sporulation protein AB [Anaeromicropila populeti]|uniref:Stage V sporulation protein AB n=1 Tax=Anaeromicropila populeti TaxID=37658 RepID=A0A1I6JQN3_9FIRM|nr:stage V sporulation protein AB [Anaeromicropila populeti]SFR81285.1 stage V sporulation protein AB [Anaeromicropila populeti]